MNRTTVLLSSAGLLVVLAVVVGLPRVRTGPPEPRPAVPTPAVPAAATGSLTVSGALARPWLSPGVSDVHATLEVAAVDVPGARRAPVNLAVVLDRSGSMTGAKLEGARQAALRLVGLLDEHDRLSISHYGNGVVTFPGTFATPAAREAMVAFLKHIEAEGGTNLGEGLAAGKAELDRARSDFRVNRLLLLSDGQPTVGMTSPQALAGLVASYRQGGVSVTSLGVGADFNEDLMQRLADVGGGSYAFIQEQDPAAMTRLFESDLQQAGTLVAQGATLTFTLPPGMRFVEVYGRPASVEGDQVRVTLPDFSARQREKLVVHLQATVAAREGTVTVASARLTYTDLLADRPASGELALTAAATTDPALAARPAAPEVMVQVGRARAGANYQAAAEALDKGDAAAAQAALARNAAVLDEVERAVGVGSMAEEKSAGALMYGLSIAPAAARPEAVKLMKVQSLKSAGRGESVKK